MEIGTITTLTTADLVPRKPGRPQGSLGRITEGHHLVAQLTAGGASIADICRITGRSYPTIKSWQQSPAFEELVAQYREEAVGEAPLDQLTYRLKLSQEIAVMATEELHWRMKHEPETIGVERLLKLAADMNDRTGLGRQETRINMNLDVGSRLEKAIEAKRKLDSVRASGGKVVDIFARKVG